MTEDNANFPIVKYLSKALCQSGHLKDKTIAWHCHLTILTELAAQAVLAAGARMILSECNSGTTQMEAVENLRKLGATVYLGTDSASHAAAKRVDIVADTGFVLIPEYLKADHKGLDDTGASEITTSGITSLRERQAKEKLPLTVVNINDGRLKSLIENFHGVGDGVVEALSLVLGAIGENLEGKLVGVAGYGRVGAGCAYHLKRAGARVQVIDKNPVQALTAHYDGFEITTLEDGLSRFDILVTATGCANLLGEEEWRQARENLLVANVGHRAEEVSPHLLKPEVKDPEEGTDGKIRGLKHYRFEGKRVALLTEGNPCNVALLTGSDEPTMIHLSTEILTWDHLAAHVSSMKNGESIIPLEVEERSAGLALKALGYDFFASL